MKWAVKTNWFPYALSNLSFDLAQLTQNEDVEYKWDNERRLRIPNGDGGNHVFEVKDHTAVVAWEEDSTGEISCPTVTYYRVGLIDGAHLDQLLMATLASRMTAARHLGKPVSISNIKLRA